MPTIDVNPSRARSVLPQFDRFVVERLLGHGAQGSVYLAKDTRLQRPVALKTLKRMASPNGMRDQLAEARTVSGLQHPNIITLFDAETIDDSAYLVFEYVDGETLAARIARLGTLAIHDALHIAKGILRGIACAHERGTLHCDLKPANVLIDASGVPRVMDFGIAQRATQSASMTSAHGFSGTPCYMAPELANGVPASAASDLFAVGVLLYEMLCGKPPVVGTNAFEVMHRMAQEEYAPAASLRAEVDPKLNQLVMRAIAKSPSDRFVDAQSFLAAIEDYISPSSTESTDGKNSSQPATLEFLIQRMRFKGDFPVLSGAVSAINRIVASDSEPASKLTNIILKDVALTNKLLRLVNAASYNRYGGSINTISRAVTLLGFDKVRNAALSLVLFEHLQNRAHAQTLQQIVGGCFFSGMLAAELAGHAGRADREEIGICAMFHDLGKLIATFYLQEEAAQIAQVAHAKNIDEERAAVDVIGISYSALGQGVARYWKLPQEIIDSMTPIAETDLTPGMCEREPARVMAACAGEISTLTTADDKTRKSALSRITLRYAKPLGLTADAMSRLVDHATERFASEASHIGLRCNIGKLRTEAEKIASTMRGETSLSKDAASLATPNTSGPQRSASTLRDREQDAAIPGELAHDAAIGNIDARGQLIAGIQDITETLAGEYDLAQALRIILETIYRSGRFTRVLLFTRDVRGENLLCRLAFGRDAEKYTSEQLPISLSAARNVFYGSLSRGADVAIQDVQSEKVAPLIPVWYTKKLNARGMLLLPLMIKSRAAGLIYADCDAPAAQFEEEDLRLLRTLRSQAVMAIRQKEVS